MLRIAGRRSLNFLSTDSSSSNIFLAQIRGLSTLGHELDKNPTSKIICNQDQERYPLGDPRKRAFSYFVVNGGKYVFASTAGLLILKFVLSMSAKKEALASTCVEVDISALRPEFLREVEWRGKPVIIRRRTEDAMKQVNSVDVASMRDPEEDAARVKKPEWIVLIGLCTHMGCASLNPYPDGFFCSCHGSVYDWSGRILRGPARFNLKVPPYQFLDDNKLLIG